MTPETKERFKNWQEEKNFEEKLERQLRDEGHNYG
jgi:hypothetical protein